MSEKTLSYILVLIIGAFIGGLLVYHFFPKKLTEYVYKDKIVKEIKTDTLFLTKFIRMKGKVDTIYVSQAGQEYEDYFTGYEDQKITRAVADTSLENDKLKLNVKYYIEPNIFDINYKIKELEKTLLIDKTPKFFIGVGVGVNYNTKLDAGYQLGIYYNLYGIK